MKARQHSSLICRIKCGVMLALMLLPHANAQEGPVSLLPPNTAATVARGKVEYPDFAVPGEKLEEVLKATTMTADEEELLQTVKDEPISRLIELINVYDRLDNRALVQALSDIVEKRAPNTPELARLRSLSAEMQTVRRPDYLDQQEAALRRGQRASDPEAIDAQARFLLQQKRVADAAKLLELLREANFKDRAFPYLDTLASCYFDLKRWDDAVHAWTQIEKLDIFPDVLRERAAMHVENIKLEKRIETARVNTFANPDEAVQMAASIMRDAAEQPAAIAFYVDSLHYAGRDDEALAYVKRVQSEWNGKGAFPYQRLLAHCEMNLKEWDRAREAFGEIVANPVFDEEARGDAARSVALTELAENGEAALLAAERGDESEARRWLALNKQKYPNDLEALGYEAVVRARLGEKDEALKMIEVKKQADASRGPFKLQDTLGSIYIERKEFNKAREAFNDILSDKRYDWDERRTAMRGLQDTRKAELLDIAFRALQDRRTARAKIVLETLQSEFGEGVREAEVLHAEILLAENKVLNAKAALEQIEKRTPANQTFSAETSLASAQLRSGDWDKAMERYRKIIRHPLSVAPSELIQAKWESREARAITQQAITPTVTYRRDEDGRAVKGEVTYQSPWMGTWRAGAFGRYNDFALDSATAKGSTANPNYAEGGFIVQRLFGPMLAGEVTLGLSGDEPIFGARVGNFINPGLQWSAAFQGNVRSHESMLLEAAGGREDRAVVNLSGPLVGPWNVNLNAFAFWLDLDGSDLGNGFGADALVEYVLQTESPSRPEIGLGYVGHWQKFSERLGQQQALFDGEVNQHGLQVEVRKAVSDRLRVAASATGYYAFDEAAPGFALGAGLQYYITETTALFADIRYNSESGSAQDSSVSGALEATLGASVTF